MAHVEAVFAANGNFREPPRKLATKIAYDIGHYMVRYEGSRPLNPHIVIQSWYEARDEAIALAHFKIDHCNLPHGRYSVYKRVKEVTSYA